MRTTGKRWNRDRVLKAYLARCVAVGHTATAVECGSGLVAAVRSYVGGLGLACDILGLTPNGTGPHAAPAPLPAGLTVEPDPEPAAPVAPRRDPPDGPVDLVAEREASIARQRRNRRCPPGVRPLGPTRAPSSSPPALGTTSFVPAESLTAAHWWREAS